MPAPITVLVEWCEPQLPIFRMTDGRAALARRYGVAVPYKPDEVYPPGELFPKTPAWFVRQEACARRLDAIAWGVPTQVLSKRPGTVLNRDVTDVRTLTSPFWRSMLIRPEWRCLVPFTDFCEWEGEKGAKIARWFSVPSQPITSFAGIWRPTPAGRRFAFLTCSPTPIVQPIHPKAMHVLLHEQDEQRWLDGVPAAELAMSSPSHLMRVG